MLWRRSLTCLSFMPPKTWTYFSRTTKKAVFHDTFVHLWHTHKKKTRQTPISGEPCYLYLVVVMGGVEAIPCLAPPTPKPNCQGGLLQWCGWLGLEGKGWVLEALQECLVDRQGGREENGKAIVQGQHPGPRRPLRLFLWRPLRTEQWGTNCLGLPWPEPMSERSRAVTFITWEFPPSAPTFQQIEPRFRNSEHRTLSGAAEGSKLNKIAEH